MVVAKGFIKFWGILASCALSCVSFVGSAKAIDVLTGTPVNLSVTVDGTAPFTYQWLKDGQAISGATGRDYNVASARPSDEGIYSVVVSNGAGSTTAPGAEVNVVIRIVAAANSTTSADESLALAAANQTATVGHDVTFNSTAAAVGRWQVSLDGSTWNDLENGGHYSGVTTGTLTVSNLETALNGGQYRFVSQGNAGPASSLTVNPALFPFPVGIAVDSSGTLYVTDTATDTVQKITGDGTVTLLAGSAGQTGSTDKIGIDARFNDPSGITPSADGAVYVSDSANATIRRISHDGIVSTIAGSATRRGNNDGSGTVATFSSPLGICRDSVGNLYVADALNNTVRKISVGGSVSTLAGSTGIAGSADGTGGAARFNHPSGIAVDGAGTVYVSDAMNNAIRKISPAGSVTTLAGLAGVSGSQDGVGAAALFNNPGGLGIDAVGNVYVADTGNSCIRTITPGGQVSTLAGLPGIAGLRDGTGDRAWFNQPKSLAVDGSGNIYVADTGNAAIRRIDPTGLVVTLSLSSEVAATNAITDSAGSAAVTAGTQSSSASVSSSSSSAGGGGAMEGWFVSALAMTILFGRRRRR